MPRNTTTIDIDEEINRIERERRELAADAAAIEEDLAEASDGDKDVQPGNHPEYVQSVQRGRTLDTHLSALYWARDGRGDPTHDGWGEDATVTLGAMNTGEHAEIRDRLSAARNERVGLGDSDDEGMSEIFRVAGSLVDAPFLDGSEDFEATVAMVRELPPQFSTYLKTKANEISSLGLDEGNSFSALVEEKKTSTTSPGESSSTTQRPS